MVVSGTIQKIGGSLVVRIPKRYADEHGLREGDRIEIPSIRKASKPDFSWVGSMPRVQGWTPEVKEWLRGNDRDL
jgi:antitoxin component of MazEF toxin-antitoxin module